MFYFYQALAFKNTDQGIENTIDNITFENIFLQTGLQTYSETDSKMAQYEQSNSLWPVDTIWHQTLWSTLVQVQALHQTKP